MGTTICLRLVVFPIMVIAQRNGAKLNNHLPTVQKLQCEAQLAQMKGNVKQQQFANSAMFAYMTEHGIHPAKNMWPLMMNGVVMTSMFFALRGMTAVPVESMRLGGGAWVPDLVASDPMFVLPVVAAGTMGMMMYLGADGMNTSSMPPMLLKVSCVLST